MSVDVLLSSRKNLPHEQTGDSVVMYMREGVDGLVNRARAMGVELDWSRAVIKFGDGYREESTFIWSHSLVYPELSVTVPGEEKNDGVQ